MKKVLFFAIVYFVFQMMGFAQSKIGTVSGKILDEKNEAVPFANVLLLNPKDSAMVRGAVTDMEGKFVVEKIAEGSYVLSARMIGYKNFVKAFEITAANPTVDLGTFSLASAATQLQEVAVTAAKPMIEVRNNAIVLNVSSSPTLGTGTAFDALSRAPGVSTDQDGRISLKGKQNVMVMMDGKMTYLSQDELSRLLQSLPAENIESIEVIENPSAKYDAAGNSGLINIVMKKDKNLGFNGSANFGIMQGIYPKYNGGVNFNFRQKNYNVFGNYNLSAAERFNRLEINREVPTQDGAFTYFKGNTPMKMENVNHNFKLGADFFLDKNTTLGIMASGNMGEWNGKNEGTTGITGALGGNNYNELRADNEIRNDWTNAAFNLNFKRKMGKGELTFDGDYSFWKNNGDQNNINSFYRNGEEIKEEYKPFHARTFRKSNIDIYAFKTDYSISLANGLNLEMGAKSSYVSTNNDFDFRVKQPTGEFTKDASQSNIFEYTENINAAYVNANRQFFDKKMSVQAGLRLEHTNSDGFSPTLNQRNKRDYVNLFPSLSVSYDLNKKNKVSLSYSRRIDRPSYDNLNPFVFFLDKYTYNKGNPFLNPQFTNSFGATYSFANFLFFNLNYSHTTDGISQILEQDNQTQATFQTMANLAKMENVSFNITAPIPVNKWWAMNFNLTGMYNSINSPYHDGTTIDRSMFGFISNITSTFTLPSNFKVELMSFYRSKMVWNIMTAEPMYNIDLGVSKTMMNNKLRVRASITDIFNTQEFRGLAQQGTLNSQILNKWESQTVRLNVSYSFGKNEVKPARQRKTSIDDVQQRAGTGNN